MKTIFNITDKTTNETETKEVYLCQYTDTRQPNQTLAKLYRKADKFGMAENTKIIIRKQ